MLLVVYDISDNKRRCRLHRSLRGVGRSVQYSVFECEDDVFDDVMLTVGRLIRPADRVRVYRLCGRCEGLVESFGCPVDEDPSNEDLMVPREPVPGSTAGSGGPLEQGRVQAPSFLMQRICAMSNLRESWKRVKANRGCAGADGVGLKRFESELPGRLEALQREVADGTYRARPLRTFSITKSNGGMRRLSVPTVRDRVAQQAVLRVIGPLLDREFEDSSYGYRPGRSVKQAIRRIKRLRDAGYTHVLDADITDYFGCIDHQTLLGAFQQYVKDERVAGLVRQWVAMADSAPHGQEAQLRGVPQGGVISPLLANLYLDAFDERIEALGYKLVRYADDFVVLCRSGAEAEQALADVEAILSDLRLTLNKEKTRVTSFAEGFSFLGHLLIGAFALRADRMRARRAGVLALGERARTPAGSDR